MLVAPTPTSTINSTGSTGATDARRMSTPNASAARASMSGRRSPVRDAVTKPPTTAPAPMNELMAL